MKKVFFHWESCKFETKLKYYRNTKSVPNQFANVVDNTLTDRFSMKVLEVKDDTIVNITSEIESVKNKFSTKIQGIQYPPILNMCYRFLSIIDILITN